VNKKQTLIHEVNFYRGYDCIKFECAFDSPFCKPNSGDGHGKHGVDICFTVKSPGKIITFVIYTYWGPQHRGDRTTYSISKWAFLDTLPASIYAHSDKRIRGTYWYKSKTIKLFGDNPCYTSINTLAGYDAMYSLVNGGEEALWQYLDSYHAYVFNKGPMPEPIEYFKSLR
jgi:hypothetical protein